MNDKADDGNVRRKRRRALGRPWHARRPLEVPTDPVLGQLVDRTAAAVKKLPPSERVAVTLAAQGFSSAEIADMLGLPAETVYQQLYRGRKRVRQQLEKNRNGLQALLGLIPHRLHELGRRTLHIGNSAGGPPSATLTALVPLVACSLLTPGGLTAMSAITEPTPASQLPVAQPIAQPSSTRTAAALALGAPAAPRTTVTTGQSASQPTDSSAPGLVPVRPDSPDTSTVISIAPSPHFVQDHTAVALGLGRTCTCPVLFRTMDSGASWQSTPVAATGTQVALPPTFPADGRIFIGQQAGALTPDWVSPAWGQPFTPLPFPPGAAGHLAIVGNRVLSVGTSAVWSLGAGSVAAPVLAFQGGASLAATPEAAYVLTPPHAAGTGMTLANAPELFACTPDCRSVGTVPLPGVGPVAVAGSTVIAASGSAIVLSRDGGQTFTTIRGPRDEALVDVLAAAGTAAWLVSRGRLSVRQAAGDGWADLGLDQAAGSVVPLSTTRLIVELAGGGLRCSVDGGLRWAPRCPVGASP